MFEPVALHRLRIAKHEVSKILVSNTDDLHIIQGKQFVTIPKNNIIQFINALVAYGYPEKRKGFVFNLDTNEIEVDE